MFAERLKLMRARTGKTQSKVAEELGITRGRYSLYELGHREADHKLLVKLANYYNCSTDYLLGRIDDPDYEIREDLPEEVKEAGIQAIKILVNAELTLDEIRDLVAFAERMKGKGNRTK